MGETRAVRTAGALMSALGEQWIPTVATHHANSDAMFVYRHATNKQKVKIFQPRPLWPAGIEINIPSIGTIHCYDLLDDPALVELRHMLQAFDEYEVLRYRPGKRITIAAEDSRHGPVVIKCVAKGIHKAAGSLDALQSVRHKLKFGVGKVYAEHRSKTVFMQKRLDGAEPHFENRVTSLAMATRMAYAISSLHRSGACFETMFSMDDQTQRSARYSSIIKRNFPDLSTLVETLDADLELAARRIAREPQPYVPIHGSLHSHQWLVADDELSLVDFDRAAMGHAELDIATFMAEWDYEPGARSDTVKCEFLNTIPSYNERLMSYYRAHKHLAKAFKASKGIDTVQARDKCRRDLTNARGLLDRRFGT